MSESHMMRKLSLSDVHNTSSSSSSSTPSSPRQPPVRRTRPAGNRQEEGLFMFVAGGKVSLQQLVADWLEEYKEDMDSAMVKMVQFFISASGCSGQVTLEMMETTEQGEMINRLAEQFDKETPGVAGTYPVAGQGAAAKKLRGNLSEFVLQLVKQTQNSILYDQFLMDNLVSLLTQLSDSQVRAFRHTATLSTMSLMTGLVRVVVTVMKVQRNVTAQMEREENKISADQDVSRMEVLKTKLEEMAENLEETQRMLAYMFKSVFVHRYRDMVPEIRSLCLTELGVWLLECPMVFLEDSYLKYLGWSLHDKMGCVRLASIKSLQPLYNNRDMLDKLVLLTDKFKERLVSLILDKDIDVSVCAIQLLECLVKFQSNILTDQDCEMVYELVYSAHRSVARAAGSFLQQKLFRPSMVEQVRTKRGKMRLPNTSLIRDLIQFFIESEKVDYESHLVDSLIDHPMMKDWECMTDLLVEESGPDEDELDDIQETALIVIMVASIKHMVTGDHPHGRGTGSGRKVQSAKEIRQMEKEKEVMTNHFMATLPHLIHKYLPDHDKISKLLAIPQLMNLEMFTTSRQERALDGLLKLLQEAVEKHVEEDVLQGVFKTLEILCNPESSVFTRCNTKRGQVVDTVVGHFKESLEEYNNMMTGEMEPGQDEIFNLKLSIRRISLLSNFYDLNLPEVWEDLLEIVKRAEDCARQDVDGWEPEEAVRSALLGCYYGLIWDRKVGRVDGLRDKMDRFIIICRGLVVYAKATILAEEAFISICDMIVIYENIGFKDLVAEELLKYLKDQVFTVNEINSMEVQGCEEEKEEKIVRKRNILTCYCKLLVMKLLPAKYFTVVFSNYLTCFSHYGDIMKAAFGELRESSRTVCARVILTCLVENMVKEEWDVNEEKELARRLALLLGVDGVRNREAVAFIHKEGIKVALGQGRDMVRLLIVLGEFSGRILKQDRQDVVGYLNKMVKRCNGKDWEEVVVYRNSLHGGHAEEAVGQD